MLLGYAGNGFPHNDLSRARCARDAFPGDRWWLAGEQPGRQLVPSAHQERRAEVRLSPTRASQLSRTLVALLGSTVDEDEDGDPEGEAAWYHVLIGLYPTGAEGAERPTRLPAVAGDRDKEV